MPLTFANARRYLDFNNPSWLLDEMQKVNPYKPDKLDSCIKIEMLKFYLNPARFIKIIKQVGARNLLPSFNFFVKFLLRK